MSAAPAPASPWLVSRRFDLATFTLPALASLVLGALAGRLGGAGGLTPTWAWLLLVVGIDVAHVHATTLRVYLDPGELQRRPGLYAAVPAIGLVGSVAAYAASPLLFWRLLAYLAVAHFVRQQIGWLRLYRRRAGDRSRLDRWIDEATVYAATIYPLLSWHARLPDPLHWFVPGDLVPGLPSLVAPIARPLWALALVVFGLRQLWRAARGEPGQPGKVLLVATTAATWWAGIVLWRTDFAFTVTNVVAHGVPYMAMAQRVGAPRLRAPAAGSTATGAPSPRPAVAALFAPGRLPLYLATLASLGLGEEWLWDLAVWHDHPALFGEASGALASVLGGLEGALVPLLALPQLTHYVLDAYLWRMDGSNPGLAEALELT